MVFVLYRRAIAALVTLASVLAVGLVLTPSSAQAAGCAPGSYNGSVTTSTSVRLTRTIARYGRVTFARVRVSSGAGTPTGTVSLSGAGLAGTVLTLRGGSASAKLPRNLPARHTYTVTASYGGDDCFKASSDSASYTVFRASTDIRGFSASNIRRGQHARVSGRVVTSTGQTSSGPVRIRLYFHGSLRQSRVVGVSGGNFHATLGRVYRVGSWTATATKVDNDNMARSSDSDRFRVRRR